MQLTKEKAKQLLKGDFIPGGKEVDITNLDFRETREDEVYQCCRQTGYDLQSGPLYCGNVAEYVAFTDGGLVALCGNQRRHFPPKKKES